MESNGNRSRKPTNDFEQFPEPSIKSIEVHLQRNPTTGLGFNIVGGSDLPHIPGHNGIFVSKIRNDSPASQDGHLKVGDRILTVNGIYLSDKKHDEVVDIFRKIEKDCHLVVEPDAERILLSQPSNLIMMHSANSPTQTAVSKGSKAGSKASSRVGSPNSKDASSEDSIADLVGKSNDELVKKLAPTLHVAKEVKEEKQQPNGSLKMLPPLQDAAKQKEKLSTNSMPTIEAQHAHPTVAPVTSEPSLRLNNKIDDIPQTPKKSAGILDSNSPSIHTELAFVALGIVGLGIGVYAFVRWYRRN